MDRASDKKLYQKVLDKAKRRFKYFPSAYASMWIHKEYERKGGEYLYKKNNDNLLTWKQSRWIQVLPLLEDGKIIECGDNNKLTKACRPTIRVNKDTPITIQELMEIHPIKDLIKLAKKKMRTWAV
jgi:hypothetical protein